MSNKNLPPINVPKDKLKAIIAYDKERFSKKPYTTPGSSLEMP